MRKTTAKNGALCEERSEKGRGERKVERKLQKANNIDQWKEIKKVAVTSRPNTKRETRGRTL